jgi:glycosyltransferase involved in cell wall biosynthesis
MIRVLHVLSTLRSSGAEVMLEIAGPRWAKHEVSCGVLSTGRTLGPFADRLATAGYDIHHLPLASGARYLRSYIQLVREGRYHVVHVHRERGSFLHSLAPAAVGVGTVRTLHNSYPVNHWAGRQRRRLQRRLARKAGTAFVAIGETVAENERRSFANPTRRIDNWVDTARFRPPTPELRVDARRTFGLAPETRTLVTVGNCSRIKNHPALLHALAGLPPSLDWHLLHVGAEAGEPGERALAEQLGIRDECSFLERVDPLSALRAADLFVMPSLFEGLGLATVEALSTGLPALLTSVPGNRDLEGLAERTFWSAPTAAAIRAELIRALATETTPSKAETHLQHEAVAAKYAPAAGVAAYCDLYYSLVAGQQGRSEGGT